MFKDTPEGTTHSYNDGCGDPIHNNKKPCHLGTNYDPTCIGCEAVNDEKEHVQDTSSTCKTIPVPQEESWWENEFDDKFDGMWLDGMHDYSTDEDFTECETKKKLKEFIRSLLSFERAHLTKEMQFNCGLRVARERAEERVRVVKEMQLVRNLYKFRTEVNNWNRAMAINDWLRSKYGLDDDDKLDAGEVEELAESLRDAIITTLSEAEEGTKS